MEQAMRLVDYFIRQGKEIEQAAKKYPGMLPMIKGLDAERLKPMIREQLTEGKVEETEPILIELSLMLPENEKVQEPIEEQGIKLERL